MHCTAQHMPIRSSVAKLNGKSNSDENKNIYIMLNRGENLSSEWRCVCPLFAKKNIVEAPRIM